MDATLLKTQPRWALCHRSLQPTTPASRLTRLHRYRSTVFGERLRSTTPLTGRHAVTVETEIVAAAPTGAETVRIIVKGRKLEVTDAIRNYAEKKIAQALHHYAQSIKTAEVTLSVRGGDTGTKGVKEQKTEVTIYTLRNGVVRSETAASSLYASIDLVGDKVKHKMQKVKEIAMIKGKWPGSGRYRRGERQAADIEEMQPDMESIDSDIEIEEEQMPEIVRTKMFNLEPMTPEEATEAMENLGHRFYIFQDKEGSDIRVVYKRKEFGYGLIVPKIPSKSEK